MGVIRNFVKRAFNPKQWMDTERLGQYASSIKDVATMYGTSAEPGRKESFEQATARLNLGEAEIHSQQAAFLRIAMVFVVMAVAVFAYAGYLLSGGHFRGGVVAVGVTLIALAQAFRYHFWYFQIKKRKLGCSLKEWLLEGILKR